MERLVAVKESHHKMHGPAFSDQHGRMLHSNWLEMELLDRLHEIRPSNLELIPQEVNVYEDFGI